MNLLSSLLKYTADQIAALRAKDSSQDTTVSGIDTRLGTAETKVTNMEAQLATAISAVTVDSEVQNVRVGDDNVTYSSAGIAVRTQFSNVKDDLGYEWINVNEALTADERKDKVYAASDGEYVIQTNPASVLYADVYEVKRSHKYKIKGSARIGANGYAIIAFNESVPTVTGTYLSEVIETGTATVTAYDVEYTARKDGYLFVFGGTTSGWGSLSVTDKAVYDSERIDNLEQIANQVEEVDASLSNLIATGMYIGDDTDNVLISATSNFEIYYIPVLAGKNYKVTYNSYALYGAYGAIAFSENAPVAGGSVEVLMLGSTESQNINFSYTATKAGYLLLAKAMKSGSTDYGFSVKCCEWYDPNANTPLKLQMFGDSITDDVNNTWTGHTTWAGQIGKILGKQYDLTKINSAYGGSSLTNRNQYSVVNRLPNLLDTTADAITVWGGTNDWADGVAIGDLSSADTTIVGAVKSIITYLSNNTTAAIIFATPMQRYNDTDAGRSTNANGEPLNNAGNTLAEVCEAIEQTCAFYGIDCIRMDKIAGFNRINIRSFCGDGLHPSTDKANRRIASIFGTEIIRLLMP